MKKLFIVFVVMITATAVKAQSAEDSVKAVINQLFTAMKTADGNLLLSCFADSAILQTIIEKDGKARVQNENVKDFADFVSKTTANDADERITFDDIKIDGPLAIAWTPYQFYWKGAFSHCGVDAFQLVKINGAWKIQYLIDTRRKTNCE
jgi:hypothetical protein